MWAHLNRLRKLPGSFEHSTCPIEEPIKQGYQPSGMQHSLSFSAFTPAQPQATPTMKNLNILVFLFSALTVANAASILNQQQSVLCDTQWCDNFCDGQGYPRRGCDARRVSQLFVVLLDFLTLHV